jgi:hypothetical protein
LPIYGFVVCITLDLIVWHIRVGGGMAQDQPPLLYVSALLLPFEIANPSQMVQPLQRLESKDLSSYKGSPYCNPQRAWMEIEIFLVDAQVSCHIGWGGDLGWPIFQT